MSQAMRWVTLVQGELTTSATKSDNQFAVGHRMQAKCAIPCELRQSKRVPHQICFACAALKIARRYWHRKRKIIQPHTDATIVEVVNRVFWCKSVLGLHRNEKAMNQSN